MDKVYVVFNINGNIIGVANSKEEAVKIYLQRHEIFPYRKEEDYYNYIVSKGAVTEFEINKFYYQ